MWIGDPFLFQEQRSVSVLSSSLSLFVEVSYGKNKADIWGLEKEFSRKTPPFERIDLLQQHTPSSSLPVNMTHMTPESTGGLSGSGGVETTGSDDRQKRYWHVRAAMCLVYMRGVRHIAAVQLSLNYLTGFAPFVTGFCFLLNILYSNNPQTDILMYKLRKFKGTATLKWLHIGAYIQFAKEHVDKSEGCLSDIPIEHFS